MDIYEDMEYQLKQFDAFRGKTISFDTLDFDFYDRFLHFFTFDYIHHRRKTQIKGLKVNSIHKTIKQLRIFVRDRVKRKIIPAVDLSEFKSPEEEADAIYLTMDEIASIYHLDLSPYPYLIPYRNRFVVACLTGLHFSDIVTLCSQDVRGGMIYKKQEKSDHWVVIGKPT